MFLQILLAREVLLTDFAWVGAYVQVRDVDMSSQVEFGREGLGTRGVVAGVVVDLRSHH